MPQVILILILALSIIGGGGWLLNSCTSTLADSAEQIALVNSPQSQAAGNTAKLLGEVEATAEAIRVEVLTRGQAELELERAKAEQAYTLQQAHDAQEAEHLANLADIKTAEVEATVRASVAWVKPFVDGATRLLVFAALAVAVVIGASAARRVAGAFATKVEHQSNVPLVFDYNPNTLTAPIILALVEGKPTIFNPNTGEVIPLTQARNAEGARLRYLAIQNSIALQTRGNGARDGLIIPNVDTGSDDE